jgi:pyridoxine 5-phosphate synthase
MHLLGVNIDHVATLRNARGGSEPEPVHAAGEAELGGADQITVHLREDRRHIRDRDLRLLRQVLRTPLNLEMAISPEIIAIALEVRPDTVTLVPERRQELTTEGGLEVAGRVTEVRETTARLRAAGIAVSLFLDPVPAQLEAAKTCGADAVELHTGTWARAFAERQAGAAHELKRLHDGVKQLKLLGLRPVAGHGLDYWNVPQLLAACPELEELNIGHAIISRAVFTGLARAVSEMKALMK